MEVDTTPTTLPFFFHPPDKPWPNVIYVSVSIEIDPKKCSTLVATGVVDGTVVIYYLDNVPTPTIKECTTLANRFFFSLRGKMLSHNCRSPFVVVYENNNSLTAAWIEENIVCRSNTSSIICPETSMKGLNMSPEKYSQAIGEITSKTERDQLRIWSDFDYGSLYEGMDGTESTEQMMKELSLQVYSIPHKERIGDKIRPLGLVLYVMKYVHAVI
jgi:hypothetical protein